MALLHRLCRHRLTSHHRLTACSSQILSCPSINQDSASASNAILKEVPFARFRISSCGGSRFFSTAFEAPLINEKIRVPEVRLVTDKGHFVMSSREALNQARQQKLDLVMVQKSANPPVCKIMDFHREKYNLEVKNKDRAKNQQGVTLRKGNCKEVRFSASIEAKDLKMKADTAKRLMDRGYRVRCVATGKENKDLGGLLSRLTELIQDVSVIESGPRIEKQSAYIIVRHVKFGPPKKSGAQKEARDMPQAGSDDFSDSGLEAEVEEPSQDEQEEEPLTRRIEMKVNGREISKKKAWSLQGDASNADDIFDVRFGSESNPDVSAPSRSGRALSDFSNVGGLKTSEPSPENRYKRSPKNSSNNQYPPPGPPLQGQRGFSRPDPQERWPSPSDRHVSQTANTRDGGNAAWRSPKPPSDDAAGRQTPPTPSYGIFSSSNK
ncbi:hypothetical protein MLD38_023128 [Melastoma candidum]|uniref:Uncharacterized protein n=1 Tax=Melastoma candidum TaxID=119954 RepID=A0ACB9QPZ8_9MYRT|nr:hypothetical protein MLD38_023128 [Melastoma candidum]